MLFALAAVPLVLPIKQLLRAEFLEAALELDDLRLLARPVDVALRLLEVGLQCLEVAHGVYINHHFKLQVPSVLDLIIQVLKCNLACCFHRVSILLELFGFDVADVISDVVFPVAEFTRGLP